MTSAICAIQGMGGNWIKLKGTLLIMANILPGASLPGIFFLFGSGGPEKAGEVFNSALLWTWTHEQWVRSSLCYCGYIGQTIALVTLIKGSPYLRCIGKTHKQCELQVWINHGPFRIYYRKKIKTYKQTPYCLRNKTTKVVMLSKR